MSSRKGVLFFRLSVQKLLQYQEKRPLDPDRIRRQLFIFCITSLQDRARSAGLRSYSPSVNCEPYGTAIPTRPALAPPSLPSAPSTLHPASLSRDAIRPCQSRDSQRKVNWRWRISAIRHWHDQQLF
nr:hypothetical protein CFP56_70028 [Quercus suber]